MDVFCVQVGGKLWVYGKWQMVVVEKEKREEMKAKCHAAVSFEFLGDMMEWVAVGEWKKRQRKKRNVRARFVVNRKRL